MEYYELLVMLLVVLLVSCLWSVTMKYSPKESKRQRLPPGPKKWPVIGNILQIGWPPHEAFTILAKQHGPIMTLWLGSMCTIVISSKDSARVMFKTHDLALAGRKLYEVMKGDYNNEEASLITAQYGPHWRMLRRLCTNEFFASSRIEQMTSVRSKCVDQMVQFIKEEGGFGSSCSKNNPIDVGRFFFLMAFNLIGNLIFSKDLLEQNTEMGAEFFYHTGKVMELAGRPNVADYFPLLKWFDPQGLRRKTQFHVNKAFDIAGEFLKQRMEERQNEGFGMKKKDYLDVLLECGRGDSGCSQQFSSTAINVVVFEMFTAGTDTTTSTLEWAMAELLRNRKLLERVQHEIRSVIAQGNKVEEKDIDNLPYLKAVINETLRLHPPLPFLVPHMAMESCNMSQFHIPKDAQVLVNVWAIGRDPNTWKDPLDFKPERFLESNTKLDYKGQHFEYLPFGSGRRMCPAVPLVNRVLPLALGSVLHSFDWVLPDELKPGELDMKERMGMTLRKEIALKAIPIALNA